MVIIQNSILVSSSGVVQFTTYSGETVFVNPSSYNDVAISACKGYDKVYVLIWSAKDFGKLWNMDVSSYILVLGRPNETGKVNILYRKKLDPTPGADLLFSCWVTRDYLVVTGVEDFNKSVIYFFTHDLKLVKKIDLNTSLWYTNLVVKDNDVFLVGVKIVKDMTGQVVGDMIVLEKRSFNDFRLVSSTVIADNVVVNPMTTYVEYVDATGKLYVVVNEGIPSTKGTLYVVSTDLANVVKVFSRDSDLRVVGVDEEGYLFLIAPREKKIYVVLDNKLVYDTSFFSEYTSDHELETLCIYYDGVFLPSDSRLLLYGVSLYKDPVSGIEAYYFISGQYLVKPDTHEVVAEAVCGSLRMDKLGKAILDTIVVNVDSDNIYVIVSGASNEDLSDYGVFITNQYIYRVSQEEYSREYQRMLSRIYGTLSSTPTGTTSSPQPSGGNDVTTRMLLAYSIIATILLVGLTIYVLRRRRSFQQ